MERPFTAVEEFLVLDAPDGPPSLVARADAVRRGAEVDRRTWETPAVSQIGVTPVEPERAADRRREELAAELEAASDERELPGLVGEHRQPRCYGDRVGPY